MNTRYGEDLEVQVRHLFMKCLQYVTAKVGNLYIIDYIPTFFYDSTKCCSLMSLPYDSFCQAASLGVAQKSQRIWE